MRLGVAVLLCLSGCSELFGLDEVPPFVPDAAPDVAADGPSPVMGCTPTSMIHEDFDDTKTPWFPVVPDPAVATFENGSIRVVATVADSYYMIAGERFYDMRDDQLTYEITDTGLDATSHIEVRLDGDPDERSWLQFFRTGTQLQLRRANGNGIPMTLATLAYDPALHRFLRFKHSGTQIVFQTSGTGGNDYIDRITAFDIDWAATVRPQVDFHRSNGATMFDASLHSVHGGASMVGACPIRELTETFDGDTVTHLWARSVVYQGALSQSGGAITVTNTPSTYLSSTIAPLGLYDLRNASVTLDIEQMFENTQGLWLEFGFRGIGGRAEIMKQEMGTLSIEHFDGSVVASKPYVAADHRYWRLTESGGTVTWSTSGNGSQFTPFAETMGHTGLDRADIFLHGNGQSSVQTSLRISSVIGADL